MAGIAFALRRQLAKDTYVEVLRAYLAAGVVGSGPWLVSIGAMLFLGFVAHAAGGVPAVVTQFLATVTHLMALTLIVSGVLQLVFVRFVADRVFEERRDAIAPNLLGALLVMSALGAAVGGGEAALLWSGDLRVRALFVAAFVVLGDVWILSGLLSGLKAYGHVLALFAAGYSVTVTAALGLARFGLAGYLAGFVAGHAVMLFGMLTLVLREYPLARDERDVVAFGFLDRRLVFPELALTGALFNVAVWIDKFVFWTNPATSAPLVGPVRYSVVYDVPIFLAYVSLIPGMAVFFVRIETDFAEAYDRFFRAVREGDTLVQLRSLRDDLVATARAAIYDILRVQGMTVAVLLLVADRVLSAFGIPAFYAYLFRIDVVGVGFQVMLLGIFTILFYLDYRKLVLWLCALFACGNFALSVLSQQLGPRFYGLGFGVSAALTSLVALQALSRKLDRLEYETFMR
jgi:uncharacterized membrane protein